MPDQTLEILIKMQSDMAALKQSVSEIDNLKQKIKQLEGSHVEGTRAVHKHAEGHRELHRLMHAVGHQSPILGLALRAVFSPLGALIMAGVVALQAYHHWLEEVKKKNEELDKLSAAVWEANRKGAIDAAKVAEDYSNRLKELADSHDKITEKYEHDKTILTETIKLHKALLEAMEAEETANAEKIGNEKEREDQKKTIKERFKLLNRTSDLAGEQQQQQLKIGQLQTEERAKAVAQDTAAEARNRLQQALKGSSSVEVAKAGMAKEPLDKLMGELRQYTQVYQFTRKFGFFGLPDALRNLVQMKETQSKIEDFKQNERIVEQYNKEVERLTEVSKKAAAEEEKHSEAVRKLNQDITTGGQVIGIHKTEAFQKTNIGKAEDAFSSAEDIAQKFKSGGKLSPNEDALLRSVASVFAGANVNTATAAKMLDTALNSTELQSKYMGRILNIMESTVNALKPFGNRLDDLERRIQTQNTNATH